MNTPMQQLIDKLKEEKQKLASGDTRARTIYKDCINLATSMLPAERDAIEIAFDTGVDNPHMSGQDYFNETY